MSLDQSNPARDQGLCRKKEFKDGELSVDFNDSAEFIDVGAAPRRPVGPEDIRDLQRETRHGNAPALRSG